MSNNEINIYNGCTSKPTNGTNGTSTSTSTGITSSAITPGAINEDTFIQPTRTAAHISVDCSVKTIMVADRGRPFPLTDGLVEFYTETAPYTWTLQSSITGPYVYGINSAISGNNAITTASNPSQTIFNFVFFERNTTTGNWSEIQQFNGSVGFPAAHDIDGTTAIFGTSQTNQLFIYVKASGVWTLQQAISTSGSVFGCKISGNTIVCHEGNDVQVYVRTGTIWTAQGAPIYTSNALPPANITIDNDTIVMTRQAPNSPSAAKDVDVFIRNSGVWSLQQTLTSPFLVFSHRFGDCIDIEGDDLIITDSSEGDIKRSGYYTNGDNEGIIYHYTRTGTTWTLNRKLEASDEANFLFFGERCAMSNGVIISTSRQTDKVYIFGTCLDPNAAPVANPGEDQCVVCDTILGNTAVTLDGSGSTDADNDTLTYKWTGPFGMATGVMPIVHLPIGIHEVTLVVNDGTVDSDPVTVQITIAFGVQGFLKPIRAHLAKTTDPLPDAPLKAYKKKKKLKLCFQMYCFNGDEGSSTDSNRSKSSMGSKGSHKSNDSQLHEVDFVTENDLQLLGLDSPKLISLSLLSQESPVLQIIDLDTVSGTGSGSDVDDDFTFKPKGKSSKWCYRMNTSFLVAGTYVIVIEMPDGVRYHSQITLK